MAAEFLAKRPGAAPSAKTVAAGDFWSKLFGPDFAHLTFTHLALVFVSLIVSIVIGIPLGILAAKRPATEALILGATGVIQTIPSLALLAVLIPLTGRIGAMPALLGDGAGPPCKQGTASTSRGTCNENAPGRSVHRLTSWGCDRETNAAGRSRPPG